MKKWSTFGYSLGAYNYNSLSEDFGRPDYNISIKENVSPLTNILLDVFSNSISEKNIILTFPDNVLRTIPILAYIYSFTNDKSTLIFTSHHKGFNNKSLKDFHNLNYCMLSNYGHFINYEYVIGSIRNDLLKADIKFPKSANKRKTKTIAQDLNNRLKNNDSKIILCTEDNLDIIDNLSKIHIAAIDNLENEHDTIIDVGLVIFENVDIYANSRYTTNKFLKWIKEYQERGIKFLFHFSNPNSKFIQIIKKETDSLVLPFNFDLINHTYLLDDSLEYYSNLNEYPKRKEIIKNYNLDSISFFNKHLLESEQEQYIDVVNPLIKLGNYNSYYAFGKNLLKRIKTEKIVNKKLFLISKKLFYSFLDLSINPLRLKVKYGDEVTPFKSYQLISFLDLFKKNLYKESSNYTKNLLENFIDCLYGIAFELGNSKHYGEEGSFDRLGKEYLMLDVAKNKEKYFNNNKDLIICCFNKMEASIIKNRLDHFNISGVIVKNIHWLNKSLLDDKENYNLLLPGPLPLKYFSELFMPYSKILILSYEGYNYKKLSKQLESLEYIHNIEINNAIENIGEIYDYFNIENSRIISDLKNNLEFRDISPLYEDDNKTSFDDEISNIVENIFKRSNLNDDFEESEKIEKEIAIENSKINDIHLTGKTYEFTLRNIESDEIIHKKLYANKYYNYFNDKNKLLEGSPKTIKQGNFIIFIDNDDKKTLLELVIEVYDLELAVDKNSIEYWKTKLMNHIIVNGVSGAEFNREFNKLGKNNKTVSATNHWIKGEVLGPQNVQDLYWIGRLINDDVIIENYQYMFQEIEKIRTIHRITGRRLNSIIKEIMGGKRNLGEKHLGYIGQLFYDKIKNGVYEVIEKE